MTAPAPPPLVPANVDLKGFEFMPVEWDRVFASDTWTLGTDAEKLAAIGLWGRSWRQVPAGSLPNDDRLLAHISGAGSKWRKVRDHALRGWVLCEDGRFYHRVICEKVLEAWLSRLDDQLRSGNGNAKRWNIPFDARPIEAEINEARRLLLALNPKNRLFKRKKPPGTPEGGYEGGENDPPGNPQGILTGIPTGSQQTGTQTGTVKAKAVIPSAQASPAADDPQAARADSDHPGGFEPTDPKPTDPKLVRVVTLATACAIALRKAGHDCTGNTRELGEYAKHPRASVEHIVEAGEFARCRGKAGSYVAQAALDDLSRVTETSTRITHATASRPSAADRVLANNRAAEERERLERLAAEGS